MLPKLSQPTFTLTLPSTGKQVRYRPFTVKEEKLLLIAQASGEREDYINCFKQLITNCCVDDIDVDKLAFYDIEYFFLNLRAKSVSNVVQLKVTDEYGKEIDVEVNLDDAKVHKSTVSNKIVLDAARDIGIKMRQPGFAELASLARRDDGNVTMDEGLALFISMIDCIWEGEAFYPAADADKQELAAFVEDFTAEQIKMVEAYLEDLPYVYLDLEYMNSKGEKVSKRIAGINSFFV